MAQRGASLQLNSTKNSSLPASSVVEWHQAEEEPAWQKLSPNSQRPPFLSPLTSTLTYPWFVTSRRYIEKCIFRNNFFCMTFIYLEAGKWKLGRKQKSICAKCQVRTAPCIRKQRISLFLLQARVGVQRTIFSKNFTFCQIRKKLSQNSQYFCFSHS